MLLRRVMFLKVLLFNRYFSAIFQKQHPKNFDPYQNSFSPFQQFKSMRPFNR